MKLIFYNISEIYPFLHNHLIISCLLSSIWIIEIVLSLKIHLLLDSYGCVFEL